MTTFTAAALHAVKIQVLTWNQMKSIDLSPPAALKYTGTQTLTENLKNSIQGEPLFQGIITTQFSKFSILATEFTNNPKHINSEIPSSHTLPARMLFLLFSFEYFFFFL